MFSLKLMASFSTERCYIYVCIGMYIPKFHLLSLYDATGCMYLPLVSFDTAIDISPECSVLFLFTYTLGYVKK